MAKHKELLWLSPCGPQNCFRPCSPFIPLNSLSPHPPSYRIWSQFSLHLASFWWVTLLGWPWMTSLWLCLKQCPQDGHLSSELQPICCQRFWPYSHISNQSSRDLLHDPDCIMVLWSEAWAQSVLHLKHSPSNCLPVLDLSVWTHSGVVGLAWDPTVPWIHLYHSPASLHHVTLWQ